MKDKAIKTMKTLQHLGGFGKLNIFWVVGGRERGEWSMKFKHTAYMLSKYLACFIPSRG